MNKYKCKHCGHRWYPRTPSRPAVCPGCGSARWDKPPQVKYRKKVKVSINPKNFTEGEAE